MDSAPSYYPKDLATVLRTLRLEFAHVALFYGGGQGILVASNAPLGASRSKLDTLEQGLRGFARPGRSLSTLHGDVLVLGDGIDAFIADAARETGLPENRSKRRITIWRSNIRRHGAMCYRGLRAKKWWLVWRSIAIELPFRRSWCRSRVRTVSRPMASSPICWPCRSCRSG